VFSVGDIYEFTLWLSAEQGTQTFVAEIVEVAMPLITVRLGGARRMVINTSSPHFAKAAEFVGGSLEA
jgi:hypothetical protein